MGPRLEKLDNAKAREFMPGVILAFAAMAGEAGVEFPLVISSS